MYTLTCILDSERGTTRVIGHPFVRITVPWHSCIQA